MLFFLQTTSHGAWDHWPFSSTTRRSNRLRYADHKVTTYGSQDRVASSSYYVLLLYYYISLNLRLFSTENSYWRALSIFSWRKSLQKLLIVFSAQNLNRPDASIGLSAKNVLLFDRSPSINYVFNSFVFTELHLMAFEAAFRRLCSSNL